MWKFGYAGAVKDYNPHEVVVHTVGEAPSPAFSLADGIAAAFADWDPDLLVVINAHGVSEGQGVCQIVISTHPNPVGKGPLVRPRNTEEQHFTRSSGTPGSLDGTLQSNGGGK